MKARSGVAFFFGACGCIFLTGIARGEDRAVTVVGSGEALARPDCLEIDVRASAGAELMGDAAVKYQDSLRRIRGAFAKLGMKSLKIEERALRVTSGEEGSQGPVFVAQPQPAAAKPMIHLTRSLRLSLRGIDKMDEAGVIDAISKILDTANDAGAIVGKPAGPVVYTGYNDETAGTTSVVRFLVEHPQERREEAYRKAFEEATERATRLAELAHAGLGRVVSINDSTTTAAPYVFAGQSAADHDSRLASDKLMEIPIRVTLNVSFQLIDKTTAPKTPGEK